MSGQSCSAPVAFTIFNRPESTQRVFERIASVRPRQLFVIADGPRPGRPDDIAGCRAARTVVEAIDWPCDVQTNYAEENLGLRMRMASGFDWVFDHVDRAIFLEDDTVPEPSFFPFCEELLDRYQDDARIRTITGSNFLGGKVRSTYSYHFSELHNVWGLAMWRRSWAATDLAMRHWPQVRDEGWLIDMTGSRKMAKFWATRFNNTYEGRISSWAYPYQFASWLGGALAVTPNRNLVSNIGFGAQATHTLARSSFLDLETNPIDFPLRHPPFVVVDRVSDRETIRRRLLPERSHPLWYYMRRTYYFIRCKPHHFSLKLSSPRLVDS